MQQQGKAADLKMRLGEHIVAFQGNVIVYAIKNSPYSHVADYFIPTSYFYITTVDIKSGRKITVLLITKRWDSTRALLCLRIPQTQNEVCGNATHYL